jgi:EAL domain-containing protein (putative c-di-GMP-specific phosphodiesterase class I)
LPLVGGRPDDERRLADAAERASHAPHGKLALALHLSRLKPPAPRPHHARIAQALLQDSAQRNDGQVFTMRNGDMVLLCAAPDFTAQPADSPQALPGALSQLFGADAPEGAALATLWRLRDQEGDFRAYIADRQQEPEQQSAEAIQSAYTEAAVQALESLLSAGNPAELLAQQTAIRLGGGKGMPLSSRITPLFREVTFSFAALTERHETAGALLDPFLFRHFAPRLDRRMLEHLQADLEDGGRLTRPALRLNLPINLNMTLESIASPAFARLLQAAQSHGLRIGIEVSLMEAAADPSLMVYARTILARAGFLLLLDGLDHVALSMTHPAGLQPDFVKLIWSPRLNDAPNAMRATIDAAIARLGPERIVLQRAESEAALVWGQSRGITRFQGFFLDAVQAAARIAVCHSARACTLRQCTTRSGALNPALRAGCGNPALLDMIPRAAASEPATPGPILVAQ